MANNLNEIHSAAETTQPEHVHVPVRLAVCVDGTWVGPDGISPAFRGNISNIFRIWCCIKEGEVVDNTGRKWRQERAYIKGVNDSNSWYGKLLSGALGNGVEQQIKNVYKLCCERASHPNDEIFFFGFSRGAFVARVVANLLTYMRVPGRVNDPRSFDEVYKNLLDIYKDVRSGDDRRKGSIYEYMSTCQPPPKLQYIGVLDTVKAFDDDGLYEIGIHPSHRHCRQALAMNETRAAFSPELWAVAEKTAEYELRKTSSLHSVLEAWFLGSHGDLGGGNIQDGAALYPVQWLLSEARELGLVLDFNPVTYTSSVFQNQIAIENPLEVMFPTPEAAEAEGPPPLVTLANRISVQMWDMNQVHMRKGLGLSISHRTNHWLFQSATREIFHQDRLVGYHDQASIGVFIHPSAYMIYDQNSHVIANAKEWPFLDQFSDFRRQALPDEKQIFWNQSSAIGEQVDAKFRILVCGNAGVGKSTLINMLFGVPDITQESKGQHGIHDIDQGFSPDGAKYIVHDSCGFQAGQQDEVEKVKNFLRTRLSSPEFAERLHAVLYCISSTRLRVTEAADEEFFRTLNQCDSNVPVIAVATRIDEVETLCGNQVEKAVMLEHGKKSRRQLAPSDWDEVETRMRIAVDAMKQEIINGLSRLGHQFSGPVFTSKDSQESILAVVDAITDSLTDDRVRTMFVAAQMCSVQPKIDYAIANSIRLYGHAVRTAMIPIAFSGLMATTTVTGLIVKDVLKVFQFSDYSGDVATHTISNLLINNYESNGIYVAANVLNIAAAGSLHTGVGALAGLAMGVGAYGLKLSAVPQFGRLLLMCTVDTILIMETVFWQCGTRAATAQDIHEACVSYGSRMDQVHTDIKSVLPVWGIWDAFRFQNLSRALSRIVDTYRFRKEPGIDHSLNTAESAPLLESPLGETTA